MLPAIPWLTAIKSWSQFPALSLFFASVYLFIKVKVALYTARFVPFKVCFQGGIMTAQFAKTACNALFRNKLPYGQLLKDDEVHAAEHFFSRVYVWLTSSNQANNSPGDGECAICQSDLHAPVKLVCGHVFCDDCVMQWLEVMKLISGISASLIYHSLYTCSALSLMVPARSAARWFNQPPMYISR